MLALYFTEDDLIFSEKYNLSPAAVVIEFLWNGVHHVHQYLDNDDQKIS